MTTTKKCRALIVDDSLAMCKFIEKVLSSDPDIEVVDYALDAYEARDKIKLYKPDVLTLDVEMPRMDGLTFLRNLMRLHPMPVVMISSLTAAGASVTLDALRDGAVDFMVKRHPGSTTELKEYTDEIIERVKNAAAVDMRRPTAKRTTRELPDLTQYRQKVKSGKKFSADIHRLIAIGSSTGGPEALHHFLQDLHPAQSSALVFAQHMPENFMNTFADRLNSWSSFNIQIAKQNEVIKPGMGYVAPGEQHLAVERQGGNYVCHLLSTEKVGGHRPSVDVLFNSVAKNSGNRATGVLLTGMGDDGARGLTAMKKAGSLTVVQDEKSSAVWGMPGSAYKMGGADVALDLRAIGPALNNLLSAA